MQFWVIAGLASQTWWVPLMAFVIVAVGAFIALRLGGRYEDLDEGVEPEEAVESEHAAQSADPPDDEGSSSQ